MDTFLKQQTTNQKLITLAETELYRGSDTLSYKTTGNLYNTFINDINIVSNDYEGKMYSTVLNNQKIFNEPILDENNNICINPNIKYNFNMIKETYDFAKEHGKQIKFHTFLWHNAIPENLKNEIDSVSNPVLKRKMALAFIENYACGLSNFMKENDYDLRQVEALNEIASDSNGEGVLRNSWWKNVIGKNQETGDEYFIDVLKIVRNYFPKTEIIYNEYNEFVNDKTDRIIDIVEQVKKVEQRDGVTLLNGIGLQAHYVDYLRESNRPLTTKDIVNSAAKLQEACDEKKIYITEYDFLNFQKNGNKEQLEQAFMDSYLKISNGFIIWGNSDSLTWHHCVDKNGKSRNAQIINSNGEPKPIYARYREEFFPKKEELEKSGEER
jgi:endo-1,4-beta-xylanase